jgi:hypothetical protein
MPSKAEDILANNDEIGAYTELGVALIVRASHQGYNALSQAERYYVSIYMLDMDVNNGGFYGYFTGPSADSAADAFAGLERIGAGYTRGLLAKAASIFPNAQIPKNQGDRERFLQDGSTDRWANLDQPNHFKQSLETLDRQFYQSSEPLGSLALSFARQNISEFRVD